MISPVSVTETQTRLADGCVGRSLPSVFCEPEDVVITAEGRKIAAQFFAVRENGSQRGPVFNEARALEVSELYHSGQTLREIGERYGLTRERVRQILRKVGADSLGLRKEHRRKPKPLTEQQLEIARLYESGIAPKELAERFSVNAGHIDFILNRAGVSKKTRTFWFTRKDNDWLVFECTRRWLAGESAKEICEALGLNFPTTVFRYLDKGGVEKARGKGRGNKRPRRLADGRVMPVFHPNTIKE